MANAFAGQGVAAAHERPARDRLGRAVDHAVGTAEMTVDGQKSEKIPVRE
jgi:hypothetical protein